MNELCGRCGNIKDRGWCVNCGNARDRERYSQLTREQKDARNKKYNERYSQLTTREKEIRKQKRRVRNLGKNREHLIRWGESKSRDFMIGVGYSSGDRDKDANHNQSFVGNIIIPQARSKKRRRAE